jgi:hypothetical protein
MFHDRPLGSPPAMPAPRPDSLKVLHPPILNPDGTWGDWFEIGGPTGGPDERRRWSREILVETARTAAAKADGPLTIYTFLQHARTSSPTIYLYFAGGWPELLEAAGLPGVETNSPQRWTDEELLGEYGRVRTALGRVPTGLELHRRAAPSLSTFRGRLGGLRNLEALWWEHREHARP